MPSFQCSRRGLVFCVCLLVVFLSGARRRPLTLAQSIDREIAESPALRSAFLGIQVVRLSDGKILYERNQDHLFVPASNTKLFTTALALNRLGPDYRFVTSVLASQPVDGGGSLEGDLVLVGRGDPSLSARTYPYSAEQSVTDPLKPIEDLADQLVAGGLRSLHGNVTGDDTRYPYDPYPEGWNAGDELWEYGAPVSALIVSDNRVDVQITPGDAEGELAHVAISPQYEFLHIDNRVRTVTGGATNTHMDGSPETGQIQLWGRIPMGSAPDQNPLAVADAAVFAASALRDALIRRGVNISGEAVARHRYIDQLLDPEHADQPAADPAGTELARRVSPPLIQLIQVVDKVSQNLHAEVMLREAGAVRRNVGTTGAGLRELHDFLTEIGIPEDQYNFVDGSGLSRSTLIEPQAITRLLQCMWASPNRDAWLSLLPVGGQDGSLKKRFPGHPEAVGISAKTGSLSHVRALSGYARTTGSETVAFALVLNNYLAPDAEVSRFLDNIGLKLLR